MFAGPSLSECVHGLPSPPLHAVAPCTSIDVGTCGLSRATSTVIRADANSSQPFTLTALTIVVCAMLTAADLGPTLLGVVSRRMKASSLAAMPQFHP